MLKYVVVIVILFLAARHIRWWWITREIETPQATSESLGEIEIRTLAPNLVASVLVPGDEVTSPNNAFRQLAWFIFGDNVSRESVKMTAPVTSKRVASNQKIEMTAPVTSKKTDGMTEVSFIMPSKRTKETLPVPNNKNISITEAPEKKIAVWTFSGYARAKHVQTQKELFIKQLQENNLSWKGEMTLAQYNDPWTPSRMRTNEWWAEIE